MRVSVRERKYNLWDEWNKFGSFCLFLSKIIDAKMYLVCGFIEIHIKFQK